MLHGLFHLQGWRRKALAFACGISATLTLPPFFIMPLIIPAYGILYLLLESAASPRRAFWDGWWWGWGFYITGLYWFSIALLTDPDKFAWLIPFALFALTGVIAIYSGVACYIYSRIRVGGIAGIFIFSAIWTLTEFARGHLFTGFPWNLPGYALSVSDSSLQLASIFGAYGLSWLVVFLGALPAAILLKYKNARVITIGFYILFAIGCLWGGARINSASNIPESERYVGGVMLRLVQANISQHHKWDPRLQFDGLRKNVELTDSPGIEKITHVIWPETAVPYIIQPDTTLVKHLGDMLGSKQILITGGLRADSDDIWNNISIINHKSEIVGKYDKHKLVPFGEFLPFRSLLPAAWLTPVGAKDFASGAGPQTLSWPGLPKVSPLICYEAIFPELSVGNERPELLLNLTNDAWFGLSSGPHQHFEMARMRAVEQGIPLVRVANTGITAVVDSYGVILNMLDLGQKGVLDSKLPKSQPEPTFFAHYPYAWLLTLLLCGLALYCWRKLFKKN